MSTQGFIERVCHYNKLFVSPPGYIYPCCTSTIGPIGNLKDDDIHQKIKKFYQSCQCSSFKNRKPNEEDEINIKILRSTLSIDCSASCIMCCSKSPLSEKSPYLYFDELEELISYYKPKKFEVSGGEITIQKDTMNWLEKIKSKYDISIKVISNGNLSLSSLDRMESLFDTFAISFVGFQPETYKNIMGLDIKRTLDFAQALKERNKVELQLKFLETPINIHETPLFLEWAIKTQPSKIYLHYTMNILTYINLNTPDNYWNEVMKRTGKKIRELFLKYREEISSKPNYISIGDVNAAYYQINQDFLTQNQLKNTINIL